MELKRIFACIVLALGLTSLSSSILAAPAVDAEHDIRVIIDVSGSMKQNDPDNLRVPAMKLLIGLLPAETYTGIWTFGKFVNMIVTPDFASKQWKERATRATSKIHSRGLFTDIEQAINKAAWNWKEASEKTQRTIILLTDGVVDVSKKKAESEASRERILTDLLPRMQEAGAVIHTIALSENADLELMKLMSLSTDGWQETAKNADELQRIFLRMFEKSVKPDTVPLEGNRFTLDNSISETTVVAFTSDVKKPVLLRSPDGQEHSAEKHSANMRWQANAGYAMITIEKPQAGEWELVADVDPDNRVMIVTDLKLEVGTLPNNILQGEALDYETHLTEKQGVITRREFLDLVTLQLSLQADGQEASIETLMPDAESGKYMLDLSQQLQVGRYELLTRAESPTFQREQRHIIEIHDSPVEVVLEEDSDTASAVITISAKQDLVDVTSLQITGQLSVSDSSTEAHIEPTAEGQWQLKLKDLNLGKQLIKMNAKGATPQGREFSLQLDEISLGQEVIEEEPVVDAAVEAEPAIEETPEQAGMVVTTGIILAANLLLIIPAGLAFLFWRKGKKAALEPMPEAKEKKT